MCSQPRQSRIPISHTQNVRQDARKLLSTSCAREQEVGIAWDCMGLRPSYAYQGATKMPGWEVIIVVLGPNFAEVGSSAIELPQQGPSFPTSLHTLLRPLPTSLNTLPMPLPTLLNTLPILFPTLVCNLPILFPDLLYTLPVPFQLLCTLPGPLNTAIDIQLDCNNALEETRVAIQGILNGCQVFMRVHS
jgi:hypothetical protein